MGAGGRVGMRGDLANSVVSWLAGQDMHIFLVGGCVRDELRGMPSHDLDLAVDGDALGLARRLANRFGGAYFALDEARGTGRALLRGTGGERLTVDAARFRGPDLLADLLDRDFTVNALAADVRAPERVIDPLNGRRDLEMRFIRPVSASSISSDPVRALRAVRQAAELDFALAGETKALIRRDGQALCAVASERVRDELARLLALPVAWPSLELFDDLGLLTLLFPELEPMRQLSQSPPHHLDAFDHALATVRWLEQLLCALEPPGPSPERMAPGDVPERRPSVGIPHMASLAPFAARVQRHLGIDMGGTRIRGLSLKLAALLHDTGKPGARSVEEDGRIRYFGHAVASAEIASATMRQLRFTRSEIRLVRTVVQHHMRPLF
ncbi:HD domain-containing protein, partial [Chloroflexota bacterium]